MRGSISIGLCGGFNAWTSSCSTDGSQSCWSRRLDVSWRQSCGWARRWRQSFGYLAGGINALASRPDLLSWAERVTPKALAGELRSSEPPLVVDVREAEEWGERHIEGSINLPLDELNERMAELPRGWRLVVVCTNGYRASIALSLMKRVRNVEAVDLVGGMEPGKLPGCRWPVSGRRSGALLPDESRPPRPDCVPGNDLGRERRRHAVVEGLRRKNYSAALSALSAVSAVKIAPQGFSADGLLCAVSAV